MDVMRWWPMVGLAFGTALGFAGAFGGVGAFVLVLVLGVVGFLAGRAMTGELDLVEMLGGRRRT
jgi:nitrate/nitrite transporter NarK